AGGRRESAAAGRRLLPRSALLRRLRAGLVPEPAARGGADARHRRPALAGARARQRRRVEHAGIPDGVLVQGGVADGESEHVPRLVGAGAWTTSVRYFSSSDFSEASARSHPLPTTS